MSEVTFSFGENWQQFLESLDEHALAGAKADLDAWLGDNSVQGKSVLDVGSGSGLHSLAFHLSGATKVVSFDYDEHSVEATRSLWNEVGRPVNWAVCRGSVLDDGFVASLGVFDIVYAWGVLHHTGDMWLAVQNAAAKVKQGGLYWLALYQKGPRYERDLRRKRRYNASPRWMQRIMVGEYIGRTMTYRLLHGKNPLRWNQMTSRGMNVYHDIIDWLGGLPYEVASPGEVVSVCRQLEFELIRLQEVPEGGCNIYLFRRTGTRQAVES
jgi:2-polyprenyl-6-hydroxyphenyl methylase/3-demethylubiquinone-9 3-methyltransferase